METSAVKSVACARSTTASARHSVMSEVEDLGRIVGYAEASYTTLREVGRIGFIRVNPEGKSLGVEKMLINAASDEIEKAGVRKIRINVPTPRREITETVKNLGSERLL